MAIDMSDLPPKKPVSAPVSMQSYLDGMKVRTLWLVMASQLIITLIVAGAVIGVNISNSTSPLFWLMLAAIFGLGTAIYYWIISYITIPARDVVKAIAHVAGESTSGTPPNPNLTRYEHNGFRNILQTIYELSTHKSSEQPTKDTKSDTLLTEALASSAAGVIVLDHNRNVIYHNDKAPVETNTDDKLVPQLVFMADISLEEWLDKCDKKSVKAEMSWLRIPNKIIGEEGRKIYDIVASYSKDSRAETVLTFFDRTDVYAPEEDDLDFISFAAHELRGPITVIRGYLDVIDQEITPGLKKDQSELIKRLIVSSNRLSSYVSNILNSSRYDRRHLRLHINEQKLSDVYETVKDDMELRASSQGRLLTVDLPNSLPTVAVDTDTIGEVFSNLIDNAIKYSFEGGHVDVRAHTVGNFVEVTVADHGIGIPNNVLSSLFHKFYRSHRSRDTVAGTGIGLYLSKAIVESHGGGVDVRSQENKGSTFTFTIPTYDSVADKLKLSHNSNELLIEKGGGWIKNHSMYRG